MEQIVVRGIGFTIIFIIQKYLLLCLLFSMYALPASELDYYVKRKKG